MQNQEKIRLKLKKFSFTFTLLYVKILEYENLLPNNGGANYEL